MALPFANKPQKIPITFNLKKYNCLGKLFPDTLIYKVANEKGIPIKDITETCKDLEKTNVSSKYIKAQIEFINSLTPFERNILRVYTSDHSTINQFLRTGNAENWNTLFAIILTRSEPSLAIIADKHNFLFRLNKKSRENLIKIYNQQKYGEAQNIKEMLQNIQNYIANTGDRYEYFELIHFIQPSSQQIQKIKQILNDFLYFFCDIFNKAPINPKLFRVFRGISVSDFNIFNYKQLKDNGIISTSLNPLQARGYIWMKDKSVIMYIDIPKGTKGILLSDNRVSTFPKQVEFVLAPNSIFTKKQAYSYMGIDNKEMLHIHLVLKKNGCTTNQYPKPFRLNPKEEDIQELKKNQINVLPVYI